MALRQPRYLGLLLGLSLAVNVFAAGAFVGGWYGSRDQGAVPSEGVDLAALVAALPANVQAEARAALEVREADIGLRLEALRDARTGAELALLADAYVEDMLEEGLREVRARGGDVQAALHEVVLEMARTLDAVDRAELAALLFVDRAGGLRLAGAATATAVAAVELD